MTIMKTFRMNKKTSLISDNLTLTYRSTGYKKSNPGAIKDWLQRFDLKK